MRKFIFAAILLSSVILIAWYVYANILSPAYTSILLKNPTVITGAIEIEKNGYYILNDDITCVHTDCIVFQGPIDITKSIKFVLDCQGHTIDAQSGIGILVDGRASGTVENCVIKNCRGYGIAIHHSGYNNIINNTVENCNGYGIYNDGAGYNKFINNTVNNNERGIYVFISSNVLLINNTANNNEIHGMYLRESHNNIIVNNTLDNNFEEGALIGYEWSGYGFWSEDSYNNTLSGNHICYNNVNVKCSNIAEIDGGNNICEPVGLTCENTLNCNVGC